jgi:hypothetical protein
MWHNNLVIPFNGMHKKKLPRFLMWVNILRKLAAIRRRHNVIGIFSMWCHECALVAKYAANIFCLNIIAGYLVRMQEKQMQLI